MGQAERITFEPDFTFWPAVSPDGKMIAYSSERDGNLDLFVRQLSGQQTIQLTREPAPDWYANFTPDGSKIVFRSERDGGGLYVVEALGVTERRIADRGRLPAFSPDGSKIVYIVASALSRRGKLFVIPAAGGEARPLAPDFVLVARGASWSSPLWSADGRSVFFDGMRPGEPDTRGWWLASLDGGPPVRIKGPAESRMMRLVDAWRNGNIYYSEGTTIGGMSLFRVPLSTGAHPEAGPPELITSPASMQYGASISSDGRMVYSTMTPSINIWFVPLGAGDGKASGPPERVTSDPLGKLGVSVSADGSRLAWFAYSPETSEIRVRDTATGREKSIPCSGKTLGIFPRLSPDGSRLSYSDIAEGKRATYVVEDGAAPRPFPGPGIVVGFFPESRDLLSMVGNQLLCSDEAGNRRGVILDTAGQGVLEDVAISPASEQVAFTLERDDGSAVLCVANAGDHPAPPEKWAKIDEGFSYIGSPAWSHDGRILYYGSNRDGFYCVWTQRIGAGGKPIGAPFAAFHDHVPPDMKLYEACFMSVAPDRLYMLLSEFKGDLWSLRLRK